MVEQVHRVDLLLGAVAERVDEVALVGADALGRAPHDVHISAGEESLRLWTGGGVSKLA